MSLQEASERESALEKSAASAAARATELEVSLQEASERESALEKSAASAARATELEVSLREASKQSTTDATSRSEELVGVRFIK